MAKISTTLLPTLFLIVISAAAASASTAPITGADAPDDPPVPRIGADAIRRTCEETRYYDLCVSSLLSRPGSSDFHYLDLGKAATDATFDNATAIRHQMKKMMNNSDLDPAGKGVLRACVEQYDKGIRQLEFAETYFKSDHFNKTHDYEPAHWPPDFAEGNFENCGRILDGKSDAGAKLQVLKEKNDIATQLASNAATIIAFYIA